MYYGYIYKTINLINKKIYIGRRKGNFTPNYLGSGKHLKHAVKKYREINFKSKLIKYAKNIVELYKLEKEYIQKYRTKFGRNNIYNITDGGDDGASNNGCVIKHKKNCKCCVCKNRRGERHKLSCNCFFCKNRRGELHELDCQCCSCRAKRGEYKGKNSPIYGKHYTQTEEAKEKIRRDVSDRRWMYSSKLRRLKRVKSILVQQYLIDGWLLGNKSRRLGKLYSNWVKN